MKNCKNILLVSLLTVLSGCSVLDNSSHLVNSDDSSSLVSDETSSLTSTTTNITNNSETQITSSDTNTSTISLPSVEISASVDENYDESQNVVINLEDNNSNVLNNNGNVMVSGNVIYIGGAGNYDISGKLSDGQVVVNASDESEVNINLLGVDISCSYTSPLSMLSADKVEISAKDSTTNKITDNRVENTTYSDDTNAAIYASCDLKIKGKGQLIVNSTYNNGIGSKDDLTIKNATVYVKAINNAIKGNDSLTIESGSITAISVSGDALKTENSDISSKGNQRGSITISGGTLNLYAACDTIDASYDVIIDGNATINAYSESYSEYSGVVTTTSSDTMYIYASSSSRPGSGNLNVSQLRFAAYFLLSDATYVWQNATKVSSSSYYSLTKPSNATKVTFYAFSSSSSSNSTTSYSYCSESLTIPTSNDTYRISSANSSTKLLSGSWTNYQATSQPGFGGGFGGFNDGNQNKADYSCKGIKASNEVNISAGNINIKAHDDGIHANSDDLLETNVYGTGNVTISGGNITIYSDDDGIHADNILTISDGYIKVSNSYEALEGQIINISGGTSEIISLDDGINASGSSCQLNISGGIVYMNASGDGLDSNGNATLSGGVVLALGPSSSGNGVLDVDGTFNITGGLLFAIDTGGMNIDNQIKTTSNVSKLTSNSFSTSTNTYINITINSSIVVIVKVVKSSMRSYRMFYDTTTYGSGASVATSTSCSQTLVNDIYYLAN